MNNNYNSEEFNMFAYKWNVSFYNNITYIETQIKHTFIYNIYKYLQILYGK